MISCVVKLYSHVPTLPESFLYELEILIMIVLLNEMVMTTIDDRK